VIKSSKFKGQAVIAGGWLLVAGTLQSQSVNNHRWWWGLAT